MYLLVEGLKADADLHETTCQHRLMYWLQHRRSLSEAVKYFQTDQFGIAVVTVNLLEEGQKTPWAAEAS